VAHYRFGHSETVMPFLSMLGLYQEPHTPSLHDYYHSMLARGTKHLLNETRARAAEIAATARCILLGGTWRGGRSCRAAGARDVCWVCYCCCSPNSKSLHALQLAQLLEDADWRSLHNSEPPLSSLALCKLARHRHGCTLSLPPVSVPTMLALKHPGRGTSHTNGSKRPVAPVRLAGMTRRLLL